VTAQAKDHGNFVDILSGRATLIEYSSANLAGGVRKRAGIGEHKAQAGDCLSHDVEAGKTRSFGRVTG
jgi:hypothetical protein